VLTQEEQILEKNLSKRLREKSIWLYHYHISW
jgi:hypothetical protein